MAMSHIFAGSRLWTSSTEAICRRRYSARLKAIVTTAAMTPGPLAGPPTQGISSLPGGYSAVVSMTSAALPVAIGDSALTLRALAKPGVPLECLVKNRGSGRELLEKIPMARQC